MDPGPSPAEPFRLTKWYLDCVDAAGTAAIAYWAALSWRGLTATWQRVTVYHAGRAPRERWRLRSTPPPESADGVVRWASPALHCRVELGTAKAPVAHRLLDGDTGTIDWQCLVPGGHARFDVDGATLTGTGYAERLDMTLPPWRLPIDEVRWGRWISADAAHALVWIDWRGARPQTLVLRDGIPQVGATVGDDRVTWPGGALTLGPHRTLHEEDVSAVVQAVPGLATLLRGTPLAVRDHKWCAHGELAHAREAPVPGWAIHEIVRLQ